MRGLKCSPFIMETYGCLNEAALDLIDTLACAAKERRKQLGAPERRWKGLWLAELSRWLARCTSSAILVSCAAKRFACDAVGAEEEEFG